MGAPRRLDGGAVLATTFGLAVLVNGAMQDWWGSESFGQRRMLGLTPLFAIGLGEALAFLRRRPLLLPAAALAALVAWNLQFAYIFNSEMLATAHAGHQPRPPGRRAGGGALPHDRAP